MYSYICEFLAVFEIFFSLGIFYFNEINLSNLIYYLSICSKEVTVFHLAFYLGKKNSVRFYSFTHRNKILRFSASLHSICNLSKPYYEITFYMNMELKVLYFEIIFNCKPLIDIVSYHQTCKLYVQIQ